LRGGKFALGVLARKNLDRPGSAAAPRQGRQGFERSTRSAEMIQERAEGARTRFMAQTPPA
jgi:hypothetical protein